MKRYQLLIAVIVILLIIVGIPRLFLIPQLVRALESELGKSLNSNDVVVQVEAPWGWEVLFGRLPRLELVAHNAVIDGLRLARVELSGQQVRFDFASLWQDQELIYTQAAKVQGEIVVAEEALNELLWKEVDPDRLLQLQVSPQSIDLGGTISFWNMDWTLKVQGDLEVHHGTALRYVLKNFAVQETRIPPILLEVLSENYEFVIDLGAFPYPVEIKGVALADRQILVRFGGL